MRSFSRAFIELIEEEGSNKKGVIPESKWIFDWITISDCPICS